MTEEQVRPSITIHVQGLYPHIISAFGTTIANQLRFTFPLAHVTLKHGNRADNFVQRDMLNFDALRYDELDIVVTVGEDPTLENSLVRPYQNLQDVFQTRQNPAEMMFKAIQKEAEQKAFDISQNSDNWFQYVPEHLKASVTAYLSEQRLDPYDPNLTAEQKTAIARECRDNPRYFFREVLRVPVVP